MDLMTYVPACAVLVAEVTVAVLIVTRGAPRLARARKKARS